MTDDAIKVMDFPFNDLTALEQHRHLQLINHGFCPNEHGKLEPYIDGEKCLTCGFQKIYINQKEH